MPANGSQDQFLNNLRGAVPRFLLLFIPVAAILIITVWAFYQQEISNEKRMLTSEQQHTVHLERTSMAALLDEVVADVLIQSQHYELASWPSAPGEEVKLRLAGEFGDMLRNTRLYNQIRFWDTQGREVVRVEYQAEVLKVIPSAGLGRQVQPALLKNTLALGSGQVYISPFHYLEQPGRSKGQSNLVMLAAAPVIDHRGAKRGMVVLDYRAEQLLADLQSLADGRGAPILLSQDGGMLLKDKPAGKIPSFASRFPEAWQEVSSREKGQVFTPQGLFTFATVHAPKPVEGKPAWKIVSHIRAAKVDALLGMYLRQLIQLLAVFLTVAGIISWFLAWARGKQASARRDMKRANAELKENQQRLDEDMRAAAGIQRTLLPANLPRLPQVELAWKFTPSELVGGDLFNAYLLDQNHLALYMLDVSGHGVPAALVTVSVHETLDPRSGHVLTQGPDGEALITQPGEVLRILDREYPLERFSKTFTIVYLILDLTSGRLVYSCAGHPHPILLTGRDRLTSLDQGGTVIGLDEVVPFDEGRAQLNPGDKLILYTDGVLEYGDAQGLLFGQERFTAILQRLRTLPVAGMLERAWQELLAFGDQKPPADDVSLLGLEYRGSADQS
jgi:serine phosphatase RsbU (regulator of sigma subunit)